MVFNYRVNTMAYRSPASLNVLARLEDRLLGSEDSWWSGGPPLYTKMVAEVPRALYLNFVVSKSYLVPQAHDLFVPLELPGKDASTLFTILLFTLRNARPHWTPRFVGTLAPEFIQSNWRLYGQITAPSMEPRRGVLFVRTVTPSLLLSAFGRRFARCFPLRRARQMELEVLSGIVRGIIDPGQGTAPKLLFEGEPAEPGPPPGTLHEQFSSYDEYARWIIDQHLSLVIWPREYVVQDMHLDFQSAKITPLCSLRCDISGFGDFLPPQPLDCFLVERLVVSLDDIVSGSR